MIKKKKLGEYALEKGGLVDGPFGSNLPASDYTVKGIPVIRGVNLSKGKFRFKASNFKFVSNQTAKRLSRCACLPNDIVFTKKGTIGQVGIVPKKPFDKYIISSNQMRMRLNGEIADPLFSYYYLSSPKIVKQITMESMTTGVPKINLGYLKNFKVSFPPLSTQKKIASILSAYDDLIENNNQRIKLLEEMAEEIYKEWFVRLRFPGYKETRFLDANGKEVPHGTNGALPQKWKKVKLRDCLDHYIGGGWGEDVPKGKNTIPAHVIRGTDIPKFRKGQLNFEVLRYHTESNLSNRRFKPNDIIFEVSGGTEDQSLGRTSFLSKTALQRFDHDVIAASFCKLLRVNDSETSAYYIYSILNMMYSTGELKVFQVQSTGISNYQFEDFIVSTKISNPDKDLLKYFDGLMAPMINKIQLLGRKNQILQETRDLLLPRLISGKLSVENLEIKAIENEHALNKTAEPERNYQT